MELALKIKKTAHHLAEFLDEDEQILLLALMYKFMPMDLENIASEEDLRDIAVARKEFEEGTSPSWEDIDWD